MKHPSHYHASQPASAAHSRRAWLARSGGGLGGIALAAMLAGDREALAAGLSSPGVALHPACIYPPKVK
ncbi:MAG: hypothetical protein HQ464_02115, partial [Planctomycetes bacterium]|nr:hypothetical protein [Planctomycetota bacterium]